MKVKVTFTAVLDDQTWGFSDLIGDRDPKSVEVYNEIVELVTDNIMDTLNSHDIDVQIIYDEDETNSD